MESGYGKSSGEGAARENSDNNFNIIAIAASTGGVKAISKLVSGLPSDFPAPILVIQHLSPNFESQMSKILSKVTSLKVKPVEDGESLKKGTIYTAVPNKHIIVNPDRTISLATLDRVHFTRPAADVTFVTLASCCRDKVIGVILTGAGQDGALGALAINRAGGKIIAQEDPEVPSMPDAAIRIDDVDYITPLAEIAPLLINLVTMNR
ncbi:MAG: chemotaxis protein CheB [Methanotrichaceae archaeon]